MGKKKRRLNVKKLLVFLIVVALIILGIVVGLKKIFGNMSNPWDNAYIASTGTDIDLYDMNYISVGKVTRGVEVKEYTKKVKNKETEKEYSKIEYKGTKYLIDLNSTEKEVKNVVREKEMFVRTNITVYKSYDSVDILSYVKKGEKLDITGYDKLNEDGTVTMYKFKYNDIEGYAYSKYLVGTKEIALKNYDEDGNYVYHSTGLVDPYKVGMAGDLDFYPNVKPKFVDNVMPETARTLYLSGVAITNVDEYIKVAKDIGANAFVVDIKDGYMAYETEVSKEYAKFAYDNAYDTFENYKNNVKKLLDAGFYVIGRIVIFNDSHYAKNHPEDVIVYKSNGALFGGQSWLSPYCRSIWEYNVKLAVEAVEEIGFHEIQFDYVRFPDRTGSVNHLLDFRDKYGETKAQAVQNFLMYAADEIHKVGAYIGADVFGESAGNYVTGYGQYWPAISNVVDVISGMPYPDHFNAHAYGIKEIVWTVPEKLMTAWSSDVKDRQETIDTPAVVRTWIQSYNAIHEPKIEYGDAEIQAQIRGLYANGLTGGWMTWSSSSNISKYRSFTKAFKVNYE